MSRIQLESGVDYNLVLKPDHKEIPRGTFFLGPLALQIVTRNPRHAARIDRPYGGLIMVSPQVSNPEGSTEGRYYNVATLDSGERVNIGRDALEGTLAHPAHGFQPNPTEIAFLKNQIATHVDNRHARITVPVGPTSDGYMIMDMNSFAGTFVEA